MVKNTITLETAQLWASNWRRNPENSVKAFLIPSTDITELLEYEGVTDIRTYVGIDERGTHKLMLVGVDADGNDLIDDVKGQYIYDFTKPCPPVCDVNSPLFKLP